MNRKTIVTAAIALAALVLILVWMQGGFHSKVPGGTTVFPGEKTPGVKTVKAAISLAEGDVTVSGTVVAREIARVASRVLGYVVELNVDAGDRVKKDQVLLRIDSKEMAEREAQAKAALESAKADLVKSRNDFERYKALFEKESVAKKDYDDALARYKVAQAAEARAHAGLDEAKTQLAYAIVTAPFDGIVGERNVNLGDLATPGRQLLTTYIPRSVELVASVGEQYASYLKGGMPVTVAVPSAEVKQASSIREVVPQREEKTRTITVKAPLTEEPGLAPGLYGTLTFHTRPSQVIVIPSEAVKIVGQLETVRVAQDGTVNVRHVKTGRKMADGKVEILSGLNAGEEVIISSGS
jgi:membrane fusion protein, multidrug efflux system